MRIKARSKSSICVLAVLDDTADSRDETIPNFSKELKIEIWEQPPNWKHPHALKTKAETEAMKSLFAVGF